MSDVMTDAEQTTAAGGVRRFVFPDLIREAPRRPTTLAVLRADSSANTFGWDTVFAIRAADMNTALQQPGAYPASFAQTETGSWSGQGQFGPWQVTLGGGGGDLNMSVPITSGTMTYGGASYVLDGAVVEIQIQLIYVPQPPTNGTPNNLVPNGQTAVSVIGMTLATTLPNNIKWLAMGMMSDWFNANLGEFTHVFSTVNINMTADKAQFQWLKPQGTIGYAYNNADTLDDAVFGVMCMLTAGAMPGSQEISNAAIPSGQRAGYLIALGPYFNNVLIPGLPDMFVNASASDFTYDNSAGSVTNNKALNQPDVTVGAVSYTPQVDVNNFSVTVDGDQLVISTQKVHIAFSPGIDIYLDYTSYMHVVLTTNSSGQQVMTLQQAQDPSTSHYVNVAAWVTWTEVIAGIVAGVITAFVGKGAKAVFDVVAYRVIATIITLLIVGVISQIGSIMIAVAEGDQDKLPPIDPLKIDATNPVTWPQGAHFTLGVAQLNGVFQLGGTYTEAPA